MPSSTGALARRPFLKHKRCKAVPALRSHHKRAFLELARQMLSWERYDWKTMVFNEGKKFNLNGPDGLNWSWHELRKDLGSFCMDKLRPGIMVWWAICFKGVLPLEGHSGGIEAVYSTQILEERLLDIEEQTFEMCGLYARITRYLIQNVKKRSSSLKMMWILWSGQLDPPIFLNIIENLWKELVQRVCKNGPPFNSIDELTESVFDSWNKIEFNFIRNLYQSIPNRCISAVERNGGMTDN